MYDVISGAKPGEPINIVVDMGGLKEISRSGAMILATVQSMVSQLESGGEVVLGDVSLGIAKTLERCGLGNTFTIISMIPASETGRTIEAGW